jgi:hypothetical protein
MMKMEAFMISDLRVDLLHRVTCQMLVERGKKLKQEMWLLLSLDPG